jgi:phosphatidate phosphatase APP1
MTRPFYAAVIEDAVNSVLAAVLRRRGWTPEVLVFTGYGSLSQVRVFGRVLLARRRDDQDREADQEIARRGWRAFMTAQLSGVPTTITLGDRTVSATSDRGGYVEVMVDQHGLEAGWHQVRISTPGSAEAVGSVFVVGSEPTIGLISDVDDTVITTLLPRPLIAAWNSFIRSESARRPVPGMAELYRGLLAGHPKAPTIYLSTGAWNTAPSLTRFLRRHGFPRGPLLLTDWGPTNTGWFRSGLEHKRYSLRRLVRELPNVRWVLIGDDGQNDPGIYAEFAGEFPDHIVVTGLRQLTPGEQVLSHGLPVPAEDLTPPRRRPPETERVVRAPDGYGLLPLLRPIVAREGQR